MLLKILKKNFLRKKIITIAVFFFIMLAALLIASGTNMFVDLLGSLDYLFKKSNAPHFVQYHSGGINQAQIDEWSLGNELVKSQQTAEMINIHESNIYFKQNPNAEKSGVMEMAFVKQNNSFDFLLDLENHIISVSKGEIAVPIYYMQKKNLKIGDTITIKNTQTEVVFKVARFIRDVQMNPSIVSSKRFVVNEANFNYLKKHFGEIEYLIEFQLHDLSRTSEFSNAYKLSKLPQKGPAIDYELLQMINALTDGLVAAIIILVSLIINIVAILCLRFTILVTIEEDYKEIGVMKAIGFLPWDIKKIYMSKYFMLAASATLTGYILSLFSNHLFSANIRLYIGIAPKYFIQFLLPICAAFFIFLIVLSFCMLVLQRFNRITAVEGLRKGNTGESYIGTRLLALHKNNIFNTNFFLGLRDVLLRFRLYALLFFVFFITTFIMIVPLNFLNTVQSPEFITYMGMGQSDILIDLRQSNNILERFEQMITYLKNDKDVERFSPLITSQFEVINQAGYKQNLTVETGDFSIFPLEYLKGTAPMKDNEIALSCLSADELEKDVGHSLQLIVNDKNTTMKVSGIYQDLTNGGRTAKASISPNHETALWYMVSVNVKTNIKTKIDEYTAAFYPAKITDIKSYLSQTFGSTVNQLELLTIVAITIAILVTMLITSLFIKMLIAKDQSQIAIMKSLGFSLSNIRLQYITRSLLVLTIGILLGTIMANTMGQGLMSAVLSMMGASEIEFIINPIQAYILSPAALIVIVIITTLLSIVSTKKFNISDMTIE